jgi:putative CocE/NonD family hydrolase
MPLTSRLRGLPAPVPPSDTQVQTNVAIPAEDGTELIGDLYCPAGEPPFPAIVEITPYGSRDQAALGHTYAARGYLFLAVDARGRYRSAGNWHPLIFDRQDAHSVIGWVGRHPLCNARIGTRGHSYCGYSQLLAAVDAPSSLQAMVVGVPPGDPFENVPFQGGAYNLEDFFWLLGMTGRVCADEPEAPEAGPPSYFAPAAPPPTIGMLRERAYAERLDKEEREKFERNFVAALKTRPFGIMDLRFGIRHEVFREWTQHWRLEEYWRERSVGPGLDRTAVPTLFVSGWWDVNGRGATRFYRGMRERSATEAARRKQRLVMGPWDHDLKVPRVTNLPDFESSQVTRGASRDPMNDEFAWFDQHLLDIPPGPATASRVSLFVTGLNRWHDLDDWPPARGVAEEYYLGQGQEGAGILRRRTPTGGATTSSYRFDPDDPTPFGPFAVGGGRAPFDNSAVEAARRDLLLFDTDIFAAPAALVGEPTLLLFASADTRDFDICAKLLDVYPDGRAIYLTDGVVRARFRRGWHDPVPLAPGEVAQLTIDLWHLAHLMRPGHRLRLEVSSAALLKFDINPGSGGSLCDDAEVRASRISVLHDISHPSRLLLPVCRDPGLE